MNMATFGVTLRELRERESLSQSELARRINRSASTVSRWELGDSPYILIPSRDDIESIAFALHEDVTNSDERIVADEYVLLVAAGYIPGPEAQSILTVPVIAALATVWDILDDGLKRFVEDRVYNAIDTAMRELENVGRTDCGCGDCSAGNCTC